MRKALYPKILWLVFAISLIAGCSSNPSKYYENDGAPSSWQDFRIDSADAVPKVEKPVASTSRPYKVMGKTYYPMSGDKPFVQTGMASWYGKQFHGKKTSTGETYNMYEMSAAHPTMELPSYARVTNLENGKSVIVRFNDRGPFLRNRIADMSYAAATKLGYVNKGTAKVKIERITRAQIAAGSWDKSSKSEYVSASAPLVTATVQKVIKATTKPVSATNVNSSEDIIKELVNQQIVQPAIKSVVQKQPDIKEVKSNVKAAFSVEEVDKNRFAEGVYAMSDGSPIQQTSSEKASNVDKHEKEKTKPKQKAGGTAIHDFCVQLGAFKSEENATKMLEKARNALGSSNLVRLVNSHGFHKVVVGENLSQEKASEISRLVQNTMGSKPAIIREGQL